MPISFADRLSTYLETLTGRPLTTRAYGFAKEISQAETLEVCIDLRSTIARLLRANSIRYTEGTLLQAALTDRAAVLFRNICDRPASHESHTKDAIIDMLLTELPANRFYARFTENLPCHILIDGHNLIFRLSILFRHLFEDGRPGRLAKELLINRLLEKISQSIHLQISIWFDGATASVEERHPRLTVNYSGGTGTDRADKEIISNLKNLASGYPYPIFLVTDDIDEGRRAKRLGVQLLSCGEFRRMVDLTPAMSL